MGKYDSTKYLRQMVHRPNIVPFGNVLLIIITTIFIFTPYVIMGTFRHDFSFNFPEAKYYDIEPRDEFPVIYIYKSGMVEFGGRVIEDLSKLPMIIEYIMKEWQPVENKILLKINRDVSFEQVQEVLRAVKKAHVETVGLITQEYASYAHFLWPAKE